MRAILIFIVLFINSSTIVWCSSENISTMANVSIATYEEVLDLPNQTHKVLIDVREPKEIAETGSIPTATNIPRKCLKP